MSVSQFCHGLINLGHRIQLILPQRDDRNTDHIPDGVEHLSVRGLPLPRYPDLRFGLVAGRPLRRFWNNLAPDVVYVATQGPLGWSVSRQARKRGIPVLSGFHTNFDAYCRHYGLRLIEPLALAWLRYFHRLTDCTLVPTGEQQNRLRAIGIPEVRILGRGVDTRLFSPQRRDSELRRSWGLDDNGIAVIHVGRLAPEKNLQLAIKTYRAIQGSIDHARFVLVGNGPLEAALKRENPDFIFCGVKTGEELARHYASGDLFLFPSLTETFGNVLLEAMASGLAIVAYDYAAAKQNIRSYISGITAASGNESAFLHAALTLINDRALICTTGKHARLHAGGQDWERITLGFERLLLEYTGGKTG